MTDASKSPDLRLEIEGALYGGWTSVSIRRGIGQVAGTFDLSVSERWPGQTVPRPIQEPPAVYLSTDGPSSPVMWTTCACRTTAPPMK